MKVEKRYFSLFIICLFFLSLFPPISQAKAELTAGDVNAQSAIVMEARSGQVIFEKNADVLRYPASTVKILTVLLGIQNSDDLDKIVYASPSSVQIPEDASRLSLEVGQDIKYKDLLAGTLVGSGNDGANLIAELVAGTNANFASIMTQTAQSFGCQNTNFTNPSGLHDPSQVTTARDLATIARVAMENPTFRDMAKLSSYVIPRNSVNKGKRVSSRDRIFKKESEEENDKKYYYKDAIGIKTGYTSDAGYCYVGAAERNGLTLISVVLKANSYGNAFLDTIKLLDYGFTQFTSLSIEDIYKKHPRVVDVSHFSESDPEFGRLALNIVKTDNLADDTLIGIASKQDEMERIFKETTTIQIFYEKLVAPIEAGQELGTLIYSPKKGGANVEYKLLAARDVARRESAFLSIEEIKSRISNDPNPLPKMSSTVAVLLALLLSPFVLIYILIRRAKKARLERRQQAENTQSFRKTKIY